LTARSPTTCAQCSVASPASVPGEISQTKDPLTVLRVTAASEPTATLAAVEDVCRGGEISAAVRSAPTPGAHDLLRACRDAGRPVVIVSNNAPEAIAVYLDRHALRDLVRGVAARPQGRPDLMKPHPELVHRALQLVDQAPTRCVFIGDSVTDVQVGRRTGVRSIGYAKTPERGQQLMEAGADAVVSAMSDLVEGIQRACRVSVDP
jgi:phosphoglycolate phosphatase